MIYKTLVLAVFSLNSCKKVYSELLNAMIYSPTYFGGGFFSPRCQIISLRTQFYLSELTKQANRLQLKEIEGKAKKISLKKTWTGNNLIYTVQCFRALIIHLKILEKIFVILSKLMVHLLYLSFYLNEWYTYCKNHKMIHVYLHIMYICLYVCIGNLRHSNF